MVDATNVQPEARRPLVELARQYHALPVAIVFDLPERLCQERNQARPDRNFGPHVVRQHAQQLRRSRRGLPREDFRYITVLTSPEDVQAVTIERQPLWNNRKRDHGPFDIIGDIHGCFDELQALLGELGYQIRQESADGEPRLTVSHPAGRKLIFLGDLVDRGPNTPAVLKLVMPLVESGAALCVPGNHDVKLLRKLKGRDVQVTHGLGETLAQLAAEPPEFRQRVAAFLDSLVSHYVLDDGKLVVAHAGLKEELQGRGSGQVRAFALFGETTGETDEFGLPVRYDWAAEYRGRAIVVYGHTPVPEPAWLNRTINIDTGCVFGGRLTALRYPEQELVSVPARQTYAELARPFRPTPDQAEAMATVDRAADLLDLGDVVGKRVISTRLHHNITIREENAAAALEVMSRFAADPKWLIYLPPTMSPSETSQRPGLLEHPAEAFAYYRREGVPRVICQEKHMGSRAILVVCRDEGVAKRRIGIAEDTAGICYTRTGRPFFDDAALQNELLERVRVAVDSAGLWDELQTDWLCLDAELMPWSAKAQELVRQQYAAFGSAARAAFAAALPELRRAAARGIDLAGLLPRYEQRAELAGQYVEAYRRYCWPVRSIDDLKLAPFHLLASEGRAHFNRDHLWHLNTLARLGQTGSSLLMATSYQVVDLTDEASQQAAIGWWEALTGRGGEGMVVKPLNFVEKGSRGLVQPAIKCRSPEYLRIIYGPEYTVPENLARLRQRDLGAKRSLALREFALGVEALERFVRREPLYRVHECVFGVLALESEPVDPRL